MQEFAIRPKVYFGCDSVSFLANLKGKRALVVSDNMVEQLGFVKMVTDALTQSEVDTTVFLDVQPDPDIKVMLAGIRSYQQINPDVLVALGGGSVIDTAKGILYFLKALAVQQGQKFRKPLFVAIPSTSGTGSEVTTFAVITAQDGKVVVVDEMLAPDVAILDPLLTQNISLDITVDTGMDALIHAIEAYVSNAATDCSDALAIQAIRLIFKNLRILSRYPQNIEARTHMADASCIAGMAFTNAGLGINHSMAHALGSTFHIPHGRANTVVMDCVIAYNADLKNDINNPVAKRYAELAMLVGLPSRTVREGVVSFLQEIRDFRREIGAPNKIGDLGVDKEKFNDSIGVMAKVALEDRCTPTTPRSVTRDELEKLFLNAF